MDNNYQKKNELVNDTNTNPPVEQNGNIESNTNPSNDNQQVGYNTYSSLPGIFNNQNTVSQNRNIPPENRPVNRPMNRPVNRNNSPLRQSNPNNPVSSQQANNNMKNRGRASEGRAFAQEFYSQPNSQKPMGNERPQMNGQGRPNQPMGNERPQMNGQGRPQNPMGNERPQINGQGRPQNPMSNERPQMNGQGRPNNPMSNERPQVNTQSIPQQPITEETLKVNAQNRPHKFIDGEESKVNYAQVSENISDSNNPNNRPKRDVKYNYNALTPPDKKSTSMIILVYVIVVILLLVGVIGYFATVEASKGESKTESGFSEFFRNIGLDEIFSNDSDNDYSEDVFSSSDDIDEDYFTNSDGITLEYLDGRSDAGVTINTPVGYELEEDFSSANMAVFFNSSSDITCKAVLIDGYSSDDDTLLDDIMNPYGEAYKSAEELYDYSTTYGDAVIWQVEFQNRIETYAFIDVDYEGMLYVSMCQYNYIDEVDKSDSVLEMEHILDEIFI